MRTVTVRAGERKRILWPFHTGFFRHVVFVAEATGGGPVSGSVEERARGIFGYSSDFHALEAENRFFIGLFKAGYSLFVIPDQDVTVRFATMHVDVRDVMKWGAIAIALLFVMSQLMRVLGNGGS